MNVIQYREDEPMNAILVELMKDCDIAMQVDCADSKVGFTVQGWFMFPRGSMVRAPELEHAS